MAAKPIPDGYHSVTPYLIVDGAARLIGFIEQAFGGSVFERLDQDGRVRHAEMRVGDSVLMLSDCCEGWPAMPAAFYLYVEDCDATYRRALSAGASSTMEPADQFYGDRNGGVIDPFGNQWWIATRIENVAPDELQRRAAAQPPSRAASARRYAASSPKPEAAAGPPGLG